MNCFLLFVCFAISYMSFACEFYRWFIQKKIVFYANTAISVPRGAYECEIKSFQSFAYNHTMRFRFQYVNLLIDIFI